MKHLDPNIWDATQLMNSRGTYIINHYWANHVDPDTYNQVCGELWGPHEKTTDRIRVILLDLMTPR